MSIEMISLQGLLCCLAFFFAGVVDSITGGGGLITIPVMLATGIPVHYITGTNQCASWIGTGVAACKYVRSGNIHLKSALITLPFAAFGSYIGARLNLMVPDRYLQIFMLVTVPVIVVFVFAKKTLGEYDHADEKPMLSMALWSAIIGIVLGGYQGFYGPGAGMFFMLAYAASNAVIWNLAAAATIFNIVGSYLGAVLAIKNGVRIIRPIMFCVVALLIVKLIFDIT